MIRAGVFIGVDRTGNLQELFDAASGAESMYRWALGQGMKDGVTAELITDGNNQRVTPDRIFDAITKIIDGPGVDQLILYYAGHGVNINRNEHWLLTDAPRNANAAVDMSSSVELARFSGIPHVVVISDACRVAPEGIQAQSVRGVDIFPNDGAAMRSNPVDQFFACLRGSTAAELRDPKDAALNYTAVYTRALLDALNGSRAALLERLGVAGDTARYLKMRTLKRYLEVEIPRRVEALRLERRVNQNPDAIITSEDAWLSRIEDIPALSRRDWGSAIGRGPATPTFRETVVDLTHAALENSAADWADTVERSVRSPAVDTRFAATLDAVAPQFGPDHLETECGIKIRGARIRDVVAPRTHLHLGAEGDLVRVEGGWRGGNSVLVQFEDGCGTVVPAIAGFIAALTIENGELVDIGYEPSANSWRWEFYQDRIAELRSLRAVAAASSQQGRFQLAPADAPTVARRMQLGKGIDPALALYAAYAYYDLQDIDHIREMSSFLAGDLGVRLFDIELLSRHLLDGSADPARDIVPFVPMLAQGWSLLRAHRFHLHPALDGLESDLQDSVWSLYGPAGVKKLRTALTRGELK
ncbi:caspase family protein [Nocardia lijiangensis]|uniref:caspase family protein n=1 Tax=Nocardia lijiangensis TaxID=299618 RepID=UPI0008334791|nr:caspase family protein [Nocardia lijiangensis]